MEFFLNYSPDIYDIFWEGSSLADQMEVSQKQSFQFLKKQIYQSHLRKSTFKGFEIDLLIDPGHIFPMHKIVIEGKHRAR